MANGFIKVFRKITSWEWYGKPEMVTLWIHLLVSANWEDGVSRGIKAERGSLVTSLSELSKETGLSIQQIRTCLKQLTNNTQINTQTTNHWTKITICNYESYQGDDDTQQHTVNTPANKQTTCNYNEEEKKNLEENKENRTKEKEKTFTLPGFGTDDQTQEAPVKDAAAERQAAAERLYKLYPTKCPTSGRATGKSSSDKRKLVTLLKTMSEEHIAYCITRYLEESVASTSYIKNFSSFLNNMPDYSEPEIKFEQPAQPQQAGRKKINYYNSKDDPNNKR